MYTDVDAGDKGTVRQAFLHLHHSSLKSQLRKDCEKGKEDNTESNQQNRVAKKKRRENQGIEVMAQAYTVAVIGAGMID